MILGSRQIDAGDDAYNGTAADQRELQDPIVARRMINDCVADTHRERAQNPEDSGPQCMGTVLDLLNVSAVAAGLEPLRASPEFAQIAAKAERREREFREQ